MTVDNRVSLSTEREYRLNSDTLFKVVTKTVLSYWQTLEFAIAGTCLLNRLWALLAFMAP
jgi:hypothetical protein